MLTLLNVKIMFDVKNVDFIAKKNQPCEIVPRVKSSEVTGVRTHS